MIVVAVNTFAKCQGIAAKFRALKPNVLSRESDGGRVPFTALRGKGLKPTDVAPMNKAELTGDLYIYEQVGFDCLTGSGVSSKAFAEALEALKGVHTLNLFVNSEGGDVFEAHAIFTQLQRFEAKKKCAYIDGLAASAASFIPMAMDEIVSSPVATWMVHEAWSGAMGRAMDLRQMADLLDMQTNLIADVYANRTKQSAAKMLALMGAPPDGTWMTADEALKHGFTDRIASFGPDEADDDEADDAKGGKRAAASAVTRALNLTQLRLKSATAGDVMQARADMLRRSSAPNTPPGQPGNPRSNGKTASRP